MSGNDASRPSATRMERRQAQKRGRRRRDKQVLMPEESKKTAATAQEVRRTKLNQSAAKSVRNSNTAASSETEQSRYKSSVQVKPPERKPAAMDHLADVRREDLIRRNARTIADTVKKKAPPVNAVHTSVQQENKPVETQTSKSRKGNIGEIVFYAALALIVLCVMFVKASGEGAPQRVFGFSAFTVRTSSMESIYPKGSLILTRYVEPEELKIGDDITFMANQTATITHRIVGIIEKYGNTGERAFETQGVMNEKPDQNPVPAVNVVGKVIFCSRMLGSISSFVGKQWPILLFGVAVLCILSKVLKKILGTD